MGDLGTVFTLASFGLSVTGHGLAAAISGTTSSASNGGVWGNNVGEGPGVQATNTGSGPAHQVTGPAVFSRSGVATVAGTSAKPKSSVVVSDVALTTDSIVLATAQTLDGTAGVACVAPDASHSKFTIHLTTAAKTTVKIGWFVVN